MKSSMKLLQLLLIPDSKSMSFDHGVHISITFLPTYYLGKSYSRADDSNASYMIKFKDTLNAYFW